MMVSNSSFFNFMVSDFCIISKRKKERERERERGWEGGKEREKESESHPKARKLSLRIYKVSNKGALFLVMKTSSLSCKPQITGRPQNKIDLMPHKITNLSSRHLQNTHNRHHLTGLVKEFLGYPIN